MDPHAPQPFPGSCVSVDEEGSLAEGNCYQRIKNKDASIELAPAVHGFCAYWDSTTLEGTKCKFPFR